MTRTIGKLFCGCLLLLIVGFSTVLAQSNEQIKLEGSKRGRLNAWVTNMVLRENIGKSAEALTMRVGKHEGFDRLVFELKGDLPNFYVTYKKLPFELGDGTGVSNVRGKAFIEISFYPLNYSEENVRLNDEYNVRQNHIETPLISEIRSIGWWEGEVRYAVGLRERTPFRVQILSNPMRLVIDFKR